jgi:hypothetical protein
MGTRTKLSISIVVFSVFGLVAPTIEKALRPAISFVILFWPALLLTSGGTATTMRNDFLMAAVANVLIFAVLGFCIGLICRRPWTLLAAYGLICVVVTLGEAWGAGFSLAYFEWKEALVAMALYSIPFSALWFGNRSRIPEGSKF